MTSINSSNIDPVDGSFIVSDTTSQDIRVVCQNTLAAALSDSGKGSTKSFPPISDTIAFIKDVDWDEVKERCRGGVNNVGLVLAVLGEKVHDLGVFLAEVW